MNGCMMDYVAKLGYIRCCIDTLKKFKVQNITIVIV